MTDARLAPFSSGHTLVDGLRWHDGALWGSDFLSRHVLRLRPDPDPDGAAPVEVEVVAVVPGEPSGLGFLPDGTPLVVSQLDHVVHRIGPDGVLGVHADLAAVVRSNANDMVVRSDGTAFVGSFGYSPPAGEEPRLVGLGRITPDGAVTEVATDLHFPNGCVLTPDEGTLLVAETFAQRITAFDVACDGSLSGRRVWAQLPADASPDGMCLDDEGALWTATVAGERFLRVAEGGEVLDEVATPGRWAISCVFGGPGRDVLYCSTSATSMANLARGVAEGAIHTLVPGVRGAGTP